MSYIHACIHTYMHMSYSYTYTCMHTYRCNSYMPALHEIYFGISPKSFFLSVNISIFVLITDH